MGLATPGASRVDLALDRVVTASFADATFDRGGVPLNLLSRTTTLLGEDVGVLREEVCLVPAAGEVIRGGRVMEGLSETSIATLTLSRAR